MALRIAIFGQAAFARDVTQGIAEAGHEIVGVYAPPDAGRPDPLATLADEQGWRCFRHKRFRRKGQAIPEIVEEYQALGADLNVMPFTTVILPPEIVDAPRLGSLCFHPSILPAYRGGSALAWQIILGAEEAGVTVFRPDEGVDTGPIVVQRRGVPIAPADTTASLYFDKLYPMGVEAVLEAVALIDVGKAEFRAQEEEGASHQGLVNDEVARIDWSRPAREIDRLIRGCDPQPGALAECDSESVRLFDSRLDDGAPGGEPGEVLGLAEGRLRISCCDGAVSVGKLRVGDAKKGPAAESGLAAGARLR
jgi:methionyl-tRNA formyltransferase